MHSEMMLRIIGIGNVNEFRDSSRRAGCSLRSRRLFRLRTTARSSSACPKAGDRSAFELLVQRYDRQVLRLALNVLGSAEDARDAYQEAFLKIYRNLHSFRFECAFYTWIYRIVTNICLDHLRRRRSHPEEQPPVLRPVSFEERHDGDFFDRQQGTGTHSDPEREVLGHEIGRKVEGAALQALSPRERAHGF